MSEVAVVPVALPRTRKRSLQLAAMTLWLPCLLPLVFGTFRDCSSMVLPYVASVPIVPGVFLSALLQVKGAMAFVVAAIPTILMFAGLYAACRKLPPRLLHPLQWLAIAGISVEAVLFAEMLRM